MPVEDTPGLPREPFSLFHGSRISIRNKAPGDCAGSRRIDGLRNRTVYMQQLSTGWSDCALESANTQIAARLQTYNALQANTPESADAVTAGTECLTASSASLEGFSFPDGSRSSHYGELRDALLVAEFLEEIANICLDAADTTIFDTDASAVCIVAHAGRPRHPSSPAAGSCWMTPSRAHVWTTYRSASCRWEVNSTPCRTS